MSDFEYHYSVTIHVSRLDVLYALRGISMFAQKKGNVYKPWKHAGKDEWRKQNR